MQNQNKNEYKGYSLFNDVEEGAIRNYNRARVLFNIYEDMANKEGNMSAKGMVMVMEYFGLVPLDDRLDVHERLTALVEKMQESRVKKVH